MAVNDLRQARTDYTVAWLKFIKSYPSDPLALFCFFEGDDVKYYGIRIDLRVRPQRKYYLVCNGKGGVLRLATLVAERYPASWRAFFVDRDFDEVIEAIAGSQIYTTPCYSVENMYVTKSCFGNILRSEMKIDNDDGTGADLEASLAKYEATMNQVLDACTLLNAWLFVQRQKEKECGSKRLDIDGLNLTRWVSLSLSGVAAGYDLSSIAEKFPNQHAVSGADLSTAFDDLGTSDRILTYRGKWLLTLFRVFVTLLTQDACQRTPVLFSRKYKAKLALSGNVLSDLSQYADTPHCLVKYLNQLAQSKPVKLQ